jgi:hypothetical protein
LQVVGGRLWAVYFKGLIWFDLLGDVTEAVSSFQFSDARQLTAQVVLVLGFTRIWSEKLGRKSEVKGPIQCRAAYPSANSKV